MSTISQPRRALVEAAVQPADVAVAVVGELALGVGVVDEQAEARPVAGGGPFQHLEVAVGVAGGEDRALADVAGRCRRACRPCRR
jgi:hypothetical protein